MSADLESAAEPGPGRLLAGRVAGPPPGAVLTLIDDRGRQAGRTAPDASGAYRLAAPGPGEYVLLVSAPGHLPRAFPAPVPGPPPPAEIVLHPIADQVVGVVRAFPSGVPVEGALVVASDEAGVVRATARSAADGSYALGGLGPGPHTVTVTSGQMWPAAVGVEVPGSVRTIGCTIDMLEPAPGRWANAKGRAPDQAAEGSTSPETSEPTSPVWPARTARPPSTTT